MLFRGFVRLSAVAGVLLLGCSAVEAARLNAPSDITPIGISSDAIEVTWSTSEPNLVGFTVERSKPGKKRGFKTIATLNDGSARSYEDRGLQSDTVYYYRLRSMQEKRSRSGRLRKPKKSRKSKPVTGTTLSEAEPAPEPTATTGGPPPPPPPPPSGGNGSPWATGFGDDETDIGVAVAVDSGQNVVVTGRFMERVDFGGGRINSRGSFDAFVARYAADGTHLWSKGFGGSEGDDGRGVAVDAAGNVFVTGFFRGSANLGGSTLRSAGEMDAFLAKYAPDGTHLWSRSFGGPDTDMGSAVGTDAAGNVIMVGNFFGNVSLGGATLAPNLYTPIDLFVAKYSPEGEHLWSKNYTSGGVAIANDVAIEPDGSIAVCGKYSGSLDFGGNRMSSSNFTDDGFIAKLTPTGAHVWSRSFGSSNRDYASGVAVDASGDVFVTGRFRHNVDFGGGPLPDAGLGNAFVAKYAAANGAHRWSRYGGSFNGADAGAGIAVDANGNPTVTGQFKGVATFDGATLTSAGAGDAFLVRYTANGALRSAEALGGPGDDLGSGVVVSPSGLVIATGAFHDRGSFRSDTLTSAGRYDAYLVQLTQ